MSDQSLSAISLALIWWETIPNFIPQDKWKHISTHLVGINKCSSLTFRKQQREGR